MMLFNLTITPEPVGLGEALPLSLTQDYKNTQASITVRENDIHSPPPWKGDSIRGIYHPDSSFGDIFSARIIDRQISKATI